MSNSNLFSVIVGYRFGTEIPEKMMVTLEDIGNNGTILDELRNMFNDKYNTCTCSLNESQSSCECDGKYGDEWEILRLELEIEGDKNV